MGRHKQVTDDEILDAARECFLESGPSVPTSVIAGHLGVSEATVFKRFGTKQDLMFAALLPPESPAWTETLEHGPDDRPAIDQLREIADRYNRFMEESFPALMVLKASGHLEDARRHRTGIAPPVREMKMLGDWIGRIAAQGRIGDVDPEILAAAFLGAIHFRILVRHLSGGKTPQIPRDDFLDRLVDYLWSGVPSSEREQ